MEGVRNYLSIEAAARAELSAFPWTRFGGVRIRVTWQRFGVSGLGKISVHCNAEHAVLSGLLHATQT